MKTALCFLVCLLLAAATAMMVLRNSRPVEATTKANTPVTRPLILAGHAATYSLAATLAEGTTIAVEWAWPKGAAWSDQRDVAVSSRVAQAAAVITLRQSAPDDALYAAARAANILVAEIDTTVSEDQRTAVVRVPKGAGDGTPSPLVPLSLGNATRMAEVIARDFSRVSPSDAERVAENLRQVKERLFRLRTRVETSLAAATNLDVILVSHEWGALAEEFGLTVRPTTDADVAVVLASHALSAEQMQKWAATKATVVVLDPLVGEPLGADHYFRVMEKNLTALAAAFTPQPVAVQAQDAE